MNNHQTRNGSGWAGAAQPPALFTPSCDPDQERIWMGRAAQPPALFTPSCDANAEQALRGLSDTINNKIMEQG